MHNTMGNIKEKLVNDIRQLLDNAAGQGLQGVIESSGYKRILSHINDDEDFKKRIDEALAAAFELVADAQSVDLGVLDFDTLLSFELSINVLSNRLKEFNDMQFYGEPTGHTARVIREVEDLEERTDRIRKAMKRIKKGQSWY